jgi:REP element-mobilizing transposase RayT
MSHFRRAYVTGGSFFFTVVTERRAPIFCTDTSRVFLRTAIRECRQRWPFRIDAMVLLDDHLHAIFTLPEGDTRYSARWGWIKKEFTKAYLAAGGNEQTRSGSRVKQRRRGVLQRRFLRHAQDRFGNISYATKRTMPGILIIYTITRLNMGTWSRYMNGLIQLFTAGLNKVFTRRIGAARLMGLWSSMIWRL